jgi:competence protein ComEA
LLVGLIGIVIAIALLVSAPAPTSPEPFGEPLDFAPAAGALPVEPAATSAGVVVDVAGAVVRPGLHRLDAGARVGEAIEAAGGFAPRADLVAASQMLNLAQSLEDGAKVLVPELGTVRLDAPGGGDARIDLNHADRAGLESLPGIGPVTAGKIIEARKERRFGTVRDLRSRGLVGESVFADIKNLVSAG